MQFSTQFYDVMDPDDKPSFVQINLRLFNIQDSLDPRVLPRQRFEAVVIHVKLRICNSGPAEGISCW